jgi:hypothetical protein
VAIDVHIQDESGNTIAQYEGPPLGLHFLKLAPVSSACFRFIVPWGDATFNEEQIKVLKSELQDAASRTTEPARLRACASSTRCKSSWLARAVLTRTSSS